MKVIPASQHGSFQEAASIALSSIGTVVPFTCFLLFIKSNIQVLAFLVNPFSKGTLISI